MIFKRLVRDLSEGSGVRIARALHRLERLGESLKNEEAPRLVRAPLIEAYIEEILRLVEAVGVTSIEEILHQVLHSRSVAVEHVETRSGAQQRHDRFDASTAQVTRPAELGASSDGTRQRSTASVDAAATDTRSDRRPLPASVSLVSMGAAENAQRIDKLLKAQKYLTAYRRLANGMEKGDQEMRILAEMDSDIQQERAQPAVNG